MSFAGNQAITNNKTNVFESLLHANTIVINNDKDIEEIANDLAFYLSRKGIPVT